MDRIEIGPITHMREHPNWDRDLNKNMELVRERKEKMRNFRSQIYDANVHETYDSLLKAFRLYDSKEFSYMLKDANDEETDDGFLFNR